MNSRPFGAEQFDKLADVTGRLIRVHRELGELQAAEREGRIRSFESSDATSVSAADRFADLSVLPLSVDIIKLKAESRALEVEWQFLLTWMEVSVGVQRGS